MKATDIHGVEFEVAKLFSTLMGGEFAEDQDGNVHTLVPEITIDDDEPTEPEAT